MPLEWSWWESESRPSNFVRALESERFKLWTCQEKWMEVWCWYSDLAQNKRNKRRPALHNKIPVHYLNAKKLHDFETVHILTSLQHAHMQAMGPANVPHHRRFIPRNTKRTPSMQDPTNHCRYWNSVFRRNVQILQTRSLQDSLGKRHFHVYTCRFLYTGERFLQSHLRVSKWLRAASPTSDMSLKPSPPAQQLQCATGSYQSLPRETLPSLAHVSLLSFTPGSLFPNSLLVSILFNSSRNKEV
jgi:hypothetical protein